MNLDRKLIEHCSPTLAGIKTANLFTVKFDCEKRLHTAVNNMNLCLESKGISVKILRQKEATALIYVYRARMLKVDFKDKVAEDILKRYGYENLTVEESINRLSDRLGTFGDFPHEIGLFLGYPPPDVEGFICNKGKNCNLCGYWKVYGDTDKALTEFAKYDKCKMIYKKLWSEGRDILRLAVNKQLKVA